MSRYSDERRMAVVAKLLPPYNLSVAEVASQENISTATIYKWRKEARTEGRCLPDSSDPHRFPTKALGNDGVQAFEMTRLNLSRMTGTTFRNDDIAIIRQ